MGPPYLQSPRPGNDFGHQFDIGNCIYSYMALKTTAGETYNVIMTEGEKDSQGQ